MKIYKYPLQFAGRQEVILPADHIIFALQMQGDVPTLWVMVDPGDDSTVRVFKMYGTGQEVELCDDEQHIATVQHKGYVWHFFVEWLR